MTGTILRWNNNNKSCFLDRRLLLTRRPHGGDLDVGVYTLDVEQLTPGFEAATPVGSLITPTPTPSQPPAHLQQLSITTTPQTTTPAQQ